jgi:hypothetical protein
LFQDVFLFLVAGACAAVADNENSSIEDNYFFLINILGLGDFFPLQFVIFFFRID